MPEFEAIAIASRGQAVAINLSIAARRALGVIALADRNSIPPAFLPTVPDADRPIIAARGRAGVAAWARLAMARETPRGLTAPVGYITAAAFPDNEPAQRALFDACKAWFVGKGAKTVIAFMND